MNSTKYWIALDMVEGIGTSSLMAVHEKLSPLNLSLADIIGLSEAELETEFSFGKKISKSIVESGNFINGVENDYFNMIDSGVDIIPFFSPLYPVRIKKIMGHDAPAFLYCRGNVKILNMRGAAILGEKTISDKGELIAYMGARELVKHGISVISGFAAGAGMIAHRSAIENGGYTLAILPCGIYSLKIPEILRDLSLQDSLLAVSPFYPTKEPNVFNAFYRNSIICALSYAVYIVESPAEGGIFEAAKSAKKTGVPLYTTEYSEYPKSAEGNKKILSEMNAGGIRGRIVNDIATPNMDKIIGDVKFSD